MKCEHAAEHEEDRKARLDGEHAAEHEEDRKARLDGEAYGKAFAAQFCKDHAHSLQLLIGIYADDSAQALLASLREMFWAQLWAPTDAS